MEADMNKLALGPILMLAASSCAPTEPPTMTAKQEADFEKLLEGRVAQAPQSCVRVTDIEGNHTYGEGVIVFDGRTNRTIYVNRPPATCPELKWSRALRVRTSIAQLCRNDIVTVFDPSTG